MIDLLNPFNIAKNKQSDNTVKCLRLFELCDEAATRGFRSIPPIVKKELSELTNDLPTLKFRSDFAAELYYKRDICERIREAYTEIGEYLKLSEAYDAMDNHKYAETALNIILIKKLLEIEKLISFEGKSECLRMLQKTFNFCDNEEFKQFRLEVEQHTGSIDRFSSVYINVSPDVGVRKRTEITESSGNVGIESTVSSYLERLGVIQTEETGAPWFTMYSGFELAVLEALDSKYDISGEYSTKFRTKCESVLYAVHKGLSFYLFMQSIYEHWNEVGLSVCAPEYNDNSLNSFHGLYDPILLKESPEVIIPNDFEFSDECGFVLSGANSSGKTSFLRAVGTAFALAGCGCLISAKSACVSPMNAIYTHFPQGETVNFGFGRLKTEIEILQGFLKNDPKNSLFLFNEIFSSTNGDDAYIYTKRLTAYLIRNNAYFILISHHKTIPPRLFADGSTARLAFLTTNVLDTKYIVRRVNSPENYENESILEEYGLSAEQLKTGGQKND